MTLKGLKHILAHIFFFVCEKLPIFLKTSLNAHNGQQWSNMDEAETKQGEIQLWDGQTDRWTDQAQVQALSCAFAAKNLSAL